MARNYLQTFLWPGIITIFWILFVTVTPCLIKSSPRDKGIVRLFFIMTTVTCWLFWATCWLHQLNPTFGPKLNQNTVYIMSSEWNYRKIIVPISVTTQLNPTLSPE